MPVSRQTALIFILFLKFLFIENHIYLHHTEDGLSLEYYDCILLESAYFCRRPLEPINLTRDDDPLACQYNAGQLRHFSPSTIEGVEPYSRYPRNPSTGTDGYLCQCAEPLAFGKNCEYRLPFGETIPQTVEWQVKMRNAHPNDAQIHGSPVCYETLKCQAGLLCLDWREICDGIQHCDYGLDEENCDVLEMNVCGDDEYRCMNGMCIPDAYFLDGQFDCLDWSDELQFKKSAECAGESVSSQCDDHACPPNEWSCGDGQCIHNRLGFSHTGEYTTCQNRRDQYFMCEMNAYPLSWTLPSGRCHEGKQYEASLLANLTNEEHCEYLFRCALSLGGEKYCPCPPLTNCDDLLYARCSRYSIQYTRHLLLTSYIFIYYEIEVFSRNTNDYPFLMVQGTVRCRDSLVSIEETQVSLWGEGLERVLHNNLCQKVYGALYTEVFIGMHQCHHQEESIDLCDEWNPCMSVTRLNDGFINCLNAKDERNDTGTDVHQSCQHVQRHRFRCSTAQRTCLSLMALGNQRFDCENGFDELWLGAGRPLAQIRCHDQRKDQCSLLRRYIEQSWTVIDQEMSSSNVMIPFRSYCDTFWDLSPPADENRIECAQWWICADSQIQCHSGQCIDSNWEADYEWDCPNAEEEAKAFADTVHLLFERAKPFNVSDPRPHLLPFNCNQTHPFPCLSPHVSYSQFYCINQSQIGDLNADCAGAIDERNTFQHCSQSSMLGYHFLCPSTNTCIPYTLHCQAGYRCSNRTDDESWCSHIRLSPGCPNTEDFFCAERSCVKKGRCNRFVDCRHTEDEYMCDYPSTSRKKRIAYRAEKRFQMRMTKKIFQLPRFPADAQTIGLPTAENTSAQLTTNVSAFDRSSSAYLSAFRCNRGIGILSTNNSIICFCPDQYYGDQCQYHHDRLSVLLHLNLSQSVSKSQTDPNIVLKLLVLFIHREETVMIREAHLRPALSNNKVEKKLFHFLYSHSVTHSQQRRNRFYNRSGILEDQPYSIQIELYQLEGSQRPSLIGVWRYPIFFDYLPVYRFSKVLHLIEVNKDVNPCSSNPCHPYEQCFPLMNNRSTHLCLCQTNYTGEDCSEGFQPCFDGYCAPDALCKPNYRQQLRGNTSPYCICPSDRLGSRCDIDASLCQPNPCLNGGSCYSSTPDELLCSCPKEFDGDKCQMQKRHVRLSIDTDRRYPGVVIQYFDIDFVSADLHLVHQQAQNFLPQTIDYYYTQAEAPNLVLAKTYPSHETVAPDIYLLSVATNVQSIKGTTPVSDLNRCDLLRRDLSPIRYHWLCQNLSRLLCFRDENYLCLCVDNHRRAECFTFDAQLDRCPYCLHEGRCLRGDPRHSADFVCLCPPCYSGRQCQFSSKSFTFTLDQLFDTDLTSGQSQRTISLLIVFSLLGFLLALPSNLFSLMTFRQRVCLRTGTGHYLLTLSVVNQLNLGFFVARLTHLSLNITNRWSLNTILCKLFNYLLVSSSRMVFWLSSLIAIERVYITVVLNGQWLKQPHIGRRLIVLTFATILGSTIYEFLFYKSLSIVDTTARSMCIFEFPAARRSEWTSAHLFVSTVHSILPFVVNFTSTVLISVMMVRRKMNTRRSNQSPSMSFLARLRFVFSVLKENRELVVGPGLTLIPQLFSFPLFISSFTLDCQNIENSWLRYLLLVSYWMSFTPQMSSFFLYISPSSFYSDEWAKTKMKNWINATFRRSQVERTLGPAHTRFSTVKQ